MGSKGHSGANKKCRLVHTGTLGVRQSAELSLEPVAPEQVRIYIRCS
jgi:hypothetical protein